MPAVTSYGDTERRSYTYMTLDDHVRVARRKHILRARRAFSEGNEYIAFERIMKAARCTRWLKARQDLVDSLHQLW